ncbi:MAG: lipoate--protein ligase family protein [Syntrophales bacterium]|nr:lipoate--protein ligase family protein [Syntrophales bacterium]
MKAWRLLPFRQFSAFENMAIDEAIFRENRRREILPTLRFYGWLSPTVSIGYFQDICKEVDVKSCRRYGIDIVRRPTGGKAVFHESELTYAVVARGNYPFFSPDILGTYRVISGCIAEGLSRLGIKAEIADEGRTFQEGLLKTFCFSSPSRYELLVEGRKICGSAQVRSHGVFLQHGSILINFDPFKTCAVMLPHHHEGKKQIEQLRRSVTSIHDHVSPPIDLTMLCEVLREGFEKVMGIQFIEQDLTPPEKEIRTRLLRNKYLTNRWNMEGKVMMNES